LPINGGTRAEVVRSPAATRAPEAPAIDDESDPAPLDATALGPAVNAAARVDATVATGFMAYNCTTTYRSWTA